MVVDHWKRLQDATSSIDMSQSNWIMSQDNVKSAYGDLMQAFQHYLFERFKDDFAGLPLYQDIISKYVDSVLAAAQGFAKRTAQLEKENEELKQKLQELLDAGRS